MLTTRYCCSHIYFKKYVALSLCIWALNKAYFFTFSVLIAVSLAIYRLIEALLNGSTCSCHQQQSPSSSSPSQRNAPRNANSNAETTSSRETTTQNNRVSSIEFLAGKNISKAFVNKERGKEDNKNDTFCVFGIKVHAL